jgi:hypothetical protein
LEFPVHILLLLLEVCWFIDVGSPRGRHFDS